MNSSHMMAYYKQDRVIVPCSMRQTILNKLHAAHRGPDFTLRHARSCVFWPGLTSQITTMCKTCITCAQHTQQHPREPLQPYPVLTLPWQLVSQDLFELNGRAYLVTVDHYSDFYEIDRLPTIQSSAVIQVTKKHFGRYGVPHTLITDNGTQFTSDLFKTFANNYKFHHITSSPYWSQSNGRAEAAVKSAKHILLILLMISTWHCCLSATLPLPDTRSLQPNAFLAVRSAVISLNHHPLCCRLHRHKILL